MPAEFIDNNGKDNEVRKRESESAGAVRPQAGIGTISQADEKQHPGDGMRKIHLREANKGGRRMPRLPEAKKDAASCENARGTASRYRSVRVRMGQPGRQEACHTHYEWANAGN